MTCTTNNTMSTTLKALRLADELDALVASFGMPGRMTTEREDAAKLRRLAAVDAERGRKLALRSAGQIHDGLARCVPAQGGARHRGATVIDNTVDGAMAAHPPVQGSQS